METVKIKEFKSRCSQSIPCRWTGSRQDDVLVSAIKVLLQDVWPQADTELAKVNQLFPIPQSQYRMAVSVRSLCSATWVDTRVLCYQGLSSAAAQWPGVLCYCATVLLWDGASTRYLGPSLPHLNIKFKQGIISRYHVKVYQCCASVQCA